MQANLQQVYVQPNGRPTTALMLLLQSYERELRDLRAANEALAARVEALENP